MQVSDILRMSDDELLAQREVVVTGTVSFVSHWDTNSCVIVGSDNLRAQGVYVEGWRTPVVPAGLAGAACLEAGQDIVVHGVARHMRLEPGIRAERIEVVGRRALPEPEPTAGMVIRHGMCNNRRVCLTGVAWGGQVGLSEDAMCTTLRIGTLKGPVVVTVFGSHPELLDLRNREVSVNGFCKPIANSRGEFLFAEVEAFSAEDVRPLDPDADTVIDITRSSRGALTGSWTNDGHLRRMRGEVVYVGPRMRYSLIARPGEGPSCPQVTTRINLAAGADMPSLGETVEVEGFPVLSGDCGVLEDARFSVLPPAPARVVPDELSEADLRSLLTRRASRENDYGNRFVRVRGRAYETEFSDVLRRIVRLETPAGNLMAVVPYTEKEGFPDLVDHPLVEATGVLMTQVARTGRDVALGESRLMLRRTEDLRVIPDEVARRNRLFRWSRAGLLYGLVLPLGYGVWVLLRTLRRRALALAVAKDRRRIAEDLHDAVSQQLAGARMLIFSVKRRDSLDAESKGNLSLAIDVLESARREVRGAVLKLKDDEFSLRTAKALIREGLRQVAARGEVRVRAKLGDFPPDIAGEAKSDLIAIVQEAVTNAVRHGRPRRLAVIAGRSAEGRFVLSVLNDGTAFDPATALGPETGHFGLSGMMERAARSGFALTFGSRKGWVEVRLERNFA